MEGSSGPGWAETNHLLPDSKRSEAICHANSPHAFRASPPREMRAEPVGKELGNGWHGFSMI